MLRFGGRIEIKFETIAYIFFAEPYFVWISGGNAIVSESIDFIYFPYDLFINMIGILPTTLFPFKFELMTFASNLVNANTLEI